MRFYTVPDARAARTSVFYATGLIGFFYLMTFILGFGAMVLVGPDAIKAVDQGGNMAAPLLAEFLGGTPFLGFIAASANFPALVLSIFWRRCTTSGAVTSMALGTTMTLLLIWLSPTLQVDILKHESALFPLKNPALVTIPLSFLAGVVVSLLTSDATVAERFAGVQRRMHLGEAD
jgi:Na+(H+)/acetate symporter ActP